MENKYLLEIGVEELPSGFASSVVDCFKQKFKKLLDENEIKFASLDVFSTPRRICLILQGFDLKQPDVEKTIKGPALKIAYNDKKQLSNAALGFMKKNNLTQNQLYEDGEYIFAKVESKGKTFEEILQNNLDSLIKNFEGSHFMRWSNNNFKFQRPIRWIVSLLNNKILPLEICNIKASDVSFAHRFAKEPKVHISKIEKYFEILEQNNVIVDQTERKKRIIEKVSNLAEKENLQVVFDEALLEEVTNLCEWVNPVICSFDKKYLELPEKLIVTVMAVHQKYFPLYKNEKLINKFVTVANYIGDDFSNIILGNQRVIAARLEDAVFFHAEDSQTSLENKLEKLKGMTFQKNFGSMFEKTNRIVELSKFLLQVLNIENKDVIRTAILSKSDLSTKLVFEFTELQGEIGSHYAKLEGENENVVLGIKEHYYPLNANSKVASKQEGQIVSIADKIDTVVCTFASGQKPSGSNDPLGVRRSTLGIIKTILEKNLNINLNKLIDKTIEILPNNFVEESKLKQDVCEFFISRLKVYFNEKYRYDIVDACIENQNILENLNDFEKRLKLLFALSQKENFEKFCENANRILRLLKKENKIINVDEKLFKTTYEENLFSNLKNLKKEPTYEEIAKFLEDSLNKIELFFENVLVMDKDEKIKNNRCALLSKYKHLFDTLADFSKIVF